jgi:hypothetical protein
LPRSTRARPRGALHLDARELGAIFAGGAAGALARAALVAASDTPPGRWPWPTFAVNILCRSRSST